MGGGGGRHTLNSAILTAALPANTAFATNWELPRAAGPELDQGFRDSVGMPHRNLVPDPPAVVFGRVGSDVSALVLNTFDAGAIGATISDGWFAALWPGQFGGEICGVTTDSAGNPVSERGCDPFVSATITLLDGESLELPLADVNGTIMQSLPGAGSD